jgi:hypothetical protein
LQSSSSLFFKNIQCRMCDQNNVGWVDNKLESTLIVILGTKLVARLALDLLHKLCISWREGFGNGNGVEFIFHRFIIFARICHAFKTYKYMYKYDENFHPFSHTCFKHTKSMWKTYKPMGKKNSHIFFLLNLGVQNLWCNPKNPKVC